MAEFTKSSFPNRYEADFVPGVTTWVVIATDLTTYASLALLDAANKKSWPYKHGAQTGVDPEMGPYLGTLTVQGDAAGAASSALYVETNQTTAPSSDNPGALILPGGNAIYDASGLTNVWCRMTSASDKLRLTLKY